MALFFHSCVRCGIQLVLPVVLSCCASQGVLTRAPNHVEVRCDNADARNEATRQIKRKGYVAVASSEAASLALTIKITEGEDFSCVQFTTKDYPHVMSAEMELLDLSGTSKWKSFASRRDHTVQSAVKGAVRDAIRAPKRWLHEEIFMAPLDALLKKKRPVPLPPYQATPP